MKPIWTALAATLALASSSAFAVDNGFYFGASVGAGGVEFDQRFDGQRIDYDAGSTGFKAIAGWRFLDWLSVEANYVDLGSGEDRIDGQKVETDVSGASLSMVGFLPIGPVDLFARAGQRRRDGPDLRGGRPVPDLEPELSRGVRTLRHRGHRHGGLGVGWRDLDLPVARSVAQPQQHRPRREKFLVGSNC